MAFPTPSMDPPKHEMAFFPNMTTSLPSESAEFRRVLWTGLYSQLVLMTVPVDGEIGDEVRQDGMRRERLDSAHFSRISFLLQLTCRFG
jgi:mannose-6-phosphate isomerase-like protein (cupin superfamily)